MFDGPFPFLYLIMGRSCYTNIFVLCRPSSCCLSCTSVYMYVRTPWRWSPYICATKNLIILYRNSVTWYVPPANFPYFLPFFFTLQMRGSTMGSRSEFSSMVRFVGEKKIRPVVSLAVDGIDRADECFEVMKNGDQFGKLVIIISGESDSSKLWWTNIEVVRILYGAPASFYTNKWIFLPTGYNSVWKIKRNKKK